jgi:glycosyltransferase involved in cell wall biosynthesis
MYSLISVIIPTYNYARYLPQAVKSVLSQTYRNFEIIVVDDGSTDNTVEVLQPFKGKIEYIYQRNKGLPSAYNAGIKASKGAFIAFLDSDDLWMPQKLELQKNYFNEHPYLGMVICNGFIFDETGVIGTYFPIETPDPIPEDLHSSLFIRNIIPGNTPLIKRECFDKIGLHDESLKSAEDLDLWIRLTRYFKVGYVPELLVKYRRHAAAMSKNLERMYENKIKVINKNLLLFPDTFDKVPEVRSRLSDFHFGLALEKLKNKEYIPTLNQIVESIKSRPLWLTPLTYFYYTRLKKIF